MASKKIVTKKGMIYRAVFVIALIALGLTLNFYSIGSSDFFGYSTVGNFLIYIAFIMILVTAVNYFKKRDRIIDERIEMVRYKAMTLTFMASIVAAFAIMILDGISPITMRYSTFASYAVCAALIFYVVAYKVIERKY